MDDDSQNTGINALEHEIHELKEQLASKEFELALMKQKFVCVDSHKYNLSLSTNEITRYSRQILVPSINVDGQICLKSGRVLIVGAGGLGCPCAHYLAAAGVGEITIVDCDQVELTNLHRQILHNESKVGAAKVDSAYEHLRRINTRIKITPIHLHLNSATIKQVFENNKFDVVVDGTDNVATRYLLSDACVFNKIPLVSGSALQMEGQLTVYNYNGGPCYRCIFPKPPPPEAVSRCGDSGVLGPVSGTIGVLQALEVIKILTKQSGVLSERLLTFDGSDCSFRKISLRPRSVNCAICSKNPTITNYVDYEQFCGNSADDKIHDISILKHEDHVDVGVLTKLDDKILIDVRSEIEFNMCHLPNSINLPFSELLKENMMAKLKDLFKDMAKQNVFIVCRQGNDSQKAVVKLNQLFYESKIKFVNVRGGLKSYTSKIDPEFPMY